MHNIKYYYKVNHLNHGYDGYDNLCGDINFFFTYIIYIFTKKKKHRDYKNSSYKDKLYYLNNFFF